LLYERDKARQEGKGHGRTLISLHGFRKREGVGRRWRLTCVEAGPRPAEWAWGSAVGGRGAA
jgi:hypothetical protein